MNGFDRKRCKLGLAISLAVGLLMAFTGLYQGAHAIGIFPTQHMQAAGGGGGGSNTTWANWDGSESGWGDSTNNHIMVVGGAVGENETGQGMVSGADLVWTQNGNIAATSGGKRFVDSNGSDYFAGTQTLMDAVCSDNTWTILYHLNTVAGPPSADGYWLYLTAGGNYLYLGYLTTGTLLLQSDMGGAFAVNTVNAIPTSGDVWLGAWSDGTYMRCGFTAAGSGAIGQPTKYSDFAAGNAKSQTQNSGATGGFSGARDIFMMPGRNPMSAYIYRAVFSKLCLIDNAS